MRERELEQDPYWSDDVLLGEVTVPDGLALVRLRLHRSEEAYNRVGTRGYVHARPYVLDPKITLAVGLFPTPHER